MGSELGAASTISVVGNELCTATALHNKEVDQLGDLQEFARHREAVHEVVARKRPIAESALRGFPARHDF